MDVQPKTHLHKLLDSPGEEDESPGDPAEAGGRDGLRYKVE